MATDSPSQRADPPSALPRGTRLGEFELLHVLGSGGFGIVYLALDHALEREVAVKEYMPASLVGRTATLHVSLRSQSDADTFALGLKSFVNEARLLARFDHPSLLKVLRYWEANGTAYMAMPVLRGQNLKEMRLGSGQQPSEAWLRDLLDPLLGAIAKLHAEGVYHRDIAPDNIQIEADGHPVLLDFGAARRVISDKSQTLTAILKPAYAPIEQYADVGSVKQGPWTDLYALGATMHFLLLGRPPMPATARTIHDDLTPLASQQFAECSQGFLQIIDWMLAPRPADRPQSVSALRDALAGRSTPPVPAVPAQAAPATWDATVIIPRAPDRGQALSGEPGKVLPPRTSPAPARRSRPAPPPTVATEIQPDSRTAAAGKASRVLPIALGAGLVLVAAAALTALWPRLGGVAEQAAAASAPQAAGSAAVAASVALAASAVLATASAAPAEQAAASLTAPPAQTPMGTGPTTRSRTDGVGRTSTETAARPATEPRPTPRTSSPAPGQTPSQTPSQTLPPAVSTSVTPLPVAPQGQQPAASPPPVATGLAPPAPAATTALPVVATPERKGPEATCEGRSYLLQLVCMERECLRSENQSHADCLKWRRAARRD